MLVGEGSDRALKNASTSLPSCCCIRSTNSLGQFLVSFNSIYLPRTENTESTEKFLLQSVVNCPLQIAYLLNPFYFTIQSSSFRKHSIHSLAHFRIQFQNWCMMRLDPCIYDQRRPAGPMFVYDFSINAINIFSRLRSGESCPQEIIKCSSH